MTTQTEATKLDFEARYRVAGYGGIAFYLIGYATETREVEVWLCDDESHDHGDECGYLDFETAENPDMVRAVMVGDDREHLIDVADLAQISETDYCSECGQIGCQGDFR